MTVDTWTPAKDGDTPGELTPQAEQTVDERIYELAAGLSIEDFGKLPAKDRDMVLFAVLRSQAGMLQYLTQTVAEFESKARGLASPEGMQSLVNQFLGGGGMGSLLGGKF